jgi:hypothetical protein
VTTSNVPASRATNESSFFLALMPNRGRTRFLLGAIRFFLGVGVLGCLSVGVTVFLEFYARYSWPIAQGEVVAADVKASEGGTGRQHSRNYYVEYQVRFAVPANECLTGTTSSDQQEHLPCWGIVRTRNTRSSSTAADWLMRQRFNSAVGILHDPNGPGLKIADESPWLVYPWTEIFTMFIWMGLFLTFLNITQRRLQYLETLPDDYDKSPLPSSQPPGPNDLIDLKLS